MKCLKDEILKQVQDDENMRVPISVGTDRYETPPVLRLNLSSIINGSSGIRLQAF